MTDDERSRTPLVRTTESIVQQQDAFLARAIPHVCSYLPADVNLDIPVHFTAFIPPRSMVTGRAYYIVGAHMARTIQVGRGRGERTRMWVAGVFLVPVPFVVFLIALRRLRTSR